MSDFFISVEVNPEKFWTAKSFLPWAILTAGILILIVEMLSVPAVTLEKQVHFSVHNSSRKKNKYLFTKPCHLMEKHKIKKTGKHSCHFGRLKQVHWVHFCLLYHNKSDRSRPERTSESRDCPRLDGPGPRCCMATGPGACDAESASVSGNSRRPKRRLNSYAIVDFRGYSLASGLLERGWRCAAHRN